MTRFLVGFLCAVSLCGGAAVAHLLTAAAAPPPMQAVQVQGGNGWDIPGNDYRTMEPQGTDLSHLYQQCQNECLRDGRCRAMVMVEARFSPNGRTTCWLKTAATRQVLMVGALSMVKAPEPGRMLHNNDMPGWDYNRFELDRADANLCMEACRRDGACVTWTYVHPNVQGPRAVCYLKSGFPWYTTNSCCISGSMR